MRYSGGVLCTRQVLWSLLLAGCAAPHPCEGEGAPQTIEAAVAHLQTLPAPADAACVVRSLARPLSVVATDSVSSVQPAEGADRPRLFVLSGPLTLALATGGSGAGYLELSEQYDELRTRKAELALPLSDPTLDEAFDSIAHETYGTSCALCHEQRADHPERGSISLGLRPEPRTLLSLGDLEAIDRSCDDAGCALLEALLDGEVVEGAFPEQWETVGPPGR